MVQISKAVKGFDISSLKWNKYVCLPEQVSVDKFFIAVNIVHQRRLT